MPGKLRAGIASSVITPPTGISMSGYATRPGPAAGVHDDLYCKSIVFSNGQTKAALVSLDLLGLTFEQVARIRQAAAVKLGIPSPHIVIACSHTHAGPATQLLRFCGTPDDEYLLWLIDKTIETIGQADADISPCQIRKGECTSDLAMNRRYKTPDGSIQLADNSGGFRDTQVKIIRITREGRHGAVLYNYACHGVVLGADNVQLSADWIGAASRIIENRTGDTAMFIQGCCGNINPGIRGGFDAVEAAGKLVGEPVSDTIQSLDVSGESVLQAEISAVSSRVNLPLLPLPGKEELSKLQTAMQQEIAQARAAEKPENMLDWPKGLEEWARTAIERIEAQKVEKVLPVELSVLRVGGFRIFAIPGEVFAEYGASIKSFGPDVLVAGYANGNIGYVPTEEAYTVGGYEVDSAYKLYGVQMIGPGAENIILSAAKSLLERV